MMYSPNLLNKGCQVVVEFSGENLLTNDTMITVTVYCSCYNGCTNLSIIIIIILCTDKHTMCSFGT